LANEITGGESRIGIVDRRSARGSVPVRRSRVAGPVASAALPEERAAELAARTLAFADAQSVEDLTALLTSAGER
jgi:hypothetical protein